MSNSTKKGGGGWVVATLVGAALMLLWLLWPRKSKAAGGSSGDSGGGSSSGGDTEVDKGGIPLPGEEKDAAGNQRVPGDIDQEEISVYPDVEPDEPNMPAPSRAPLAVAQIFDSHDFDDEFVEII